MSDVRLILGRAEDVLPTWKREALARLPHGFPAATLAALLLLELPDRPGHDWPTRDPRLLAAAALGEARRRLRDADGPLFAKGEGP